jgi:hypothetical protein
VLWDVTSRFCRAETDACGRDRPVWRLLAYSAAAACLMVAMQTAGRIAEMRATAEHEMQPQQAEIRRVLKAHAGATVLMGVGAEPRSSTLFARHEIVFAGHPIAVDAAALMDYRRAGLPEPNFDKLIGDLRQRTHREIVWIIPRGEPFTAATSTTEGRCFLTTSAGLSIPHFG